jgi:cobalt/nickel transport system permease protein
LGKAVLERRGADRSAFELWSQRSSLLHSMDARAKLGAALAFLLAVATTPMVAPASYCGYSLLLLVALAAAKLPVAGIVRRAALVLPFAASFAAITWLSGDASRALALVIKSFLSGFTVVLLMATTSLTELAQALDSLGVPRPLILVIQFLYRYLFVISEQAHRMTLAARCRQGKSRPGFRAAAGSVGVLFARSWERADGIYHAMLARGFSGTFPSFTRAHFRRRDAIFLVTSVCLVLLIRLAATEIPPGVSRMP